MAKNFLIPTLNNEQTDVTVNELQKILDVLNDLALTLKHAHWNVTGPHFIAVHEMLDPEIDDVRDGVDILAERIAALGAAPNGLCHEVSGTAGTLLPKYPLTVRAVTDAHLEALNEQYTAVETLLRESIEVLDETDLISSNIVQDILGKLEQFQWKVRSHLI